MAYRIVVQMSLVKGAEARLFALMGQRHVDVEAASFQKHRAQNQIHATLDLNLDEARVRRLMRQLSRHRDIQWLAMETDEERQGMSGQSLIHPTTRRMRLSTTKGAYL